VLCSSASVRQYVANIEINPIKVGKVQLRWVQTPMMPKILMSQVAAAAAAVVVVAVVVAVVVVAIAIAAVAVAVGYCCWILVEGRKMGW
jgi:fatty acid desaturase